MKNRALDCPLLSQGQKQLQSTSHWIRVEAVEVFPSPNLSITFMGLRQVSFEDQGQPLLAVTSLRHDSTRVINEKVNASCLS
jgi:hypothetical protein